MAALQVLTSGIPALNRRKAVDYKVQKRDHAVDRSDIQEVRASHYKSSGTRFAHQGCYRDAEDLSASCAIAVGLTRGGTGCEVH